MEITSLQVPTAENVTLNCAMAGNGSPILFLHGFPEFSYQWNRQLQHFGKNRLAMAPDLRGYNLSSKPLAVDEYQMKEVAEDIRHLILHFGKVPVTLVGHDWGGVVAYHVAAKYPELLSKLVIINAPHPQIFRRELRLNPEQQKASAYMARLAMPDSPDFLAANDFEWLVTNNLGRSLKKGMLTESDVAAYKTAWSQPGALVGMTNYYRALLKETSPNPAEETRPLTINVPTMVIWGEWDRALLVGNLEGLSEYIPQLRIERVPEATHWIVTEKPELINQLIESFL